MVNISLRDKEMHFDQQPSHRTVSAEVRVAIEHANRTMAEYDAYIEQTLNNQDAPIDWTEDEYMAGRANDAERELLVAREAALNPDQECTCTPDLPDERCFPLCPVCKADIDQQDGIPFEGSGL